MKERDKALKRKNGLHTRYYDNGQILSKEHYKDGKLDGKWTRWYENGQIESEAMYMYGLLHGKSTWWLEDGQKLEMKNYHEGKVVAFDGIDPEREEKLRLKIIASQQEKLNNNYDPTNNNLILSSINILAQRISVLR